MRSEMVSFCHDSPSRKSGLDSSYESIGCSKKVIVVLPDISRWTPARQSSSWCKSNMKRLISRNSRLGYRILLYGNVYYVSETVTNRYWRESGGCGVMGKMWNTPVYATPTRFVGRSKVLSHWSSGDMGCLNNIIDIYEILLSFL